MANSNKQGFVKLYRSTIVEDLIKRNPNAFTLLTIIALRARRSEDDPNPHNLKLNQGLIGDYYNYGMSERQYRTSKTTIEATGIATFKATNKGTIATLCNTDIYDINVIKNDEQNDGQSASKSTGIATTNKKLLKKYKEAFKESNISFDFFWNLYDKKNDRKKSEKKWLSLSDKERQEIINFIPLYKAYQPDPKYRKNPVTFFNNRTWEDEFVKDQINSKRKNGKQDEGNQRNDPGNDPYDWDALAYGESLERK